MPPNYGPPYPPPPAPGSNAIGQFRIGVSLIGDIAPFRPWTTVQAQYANSPILTGIINAFAAAMDPTELLDEIFDVMWNVMTAQGYGLDCWGRIVGVTRTLQLPPGTNQFFGFQVAEDPAHFTGFNQAPFFSGEQLTSNVTLSDDQFRILVLAKAAANICDGSIPAINAVLLALFPNRGACYVTDLGGMQMTYTFNFALTPIELAIVDQSGVLPKPVGVQATVVQL